MERNKKLGGSLMQAFYMALGFAVFWLWALDLAF
jgi:hypothetical protein|tara:strand:+ start:380 stop:481 length:102 start_codon:yes stop_codon:yes gene_type:complete